MHKFIVYDAFSKPTELEKERVADFLFIHLQEYGDPRHHIKRAIDYSTKDISSFGGFTLVLKEKSKIIGAVVVNRTGMSGYIPENILVYIATHQDKRGQGIGKLLMEKVIDHAKGDIALHVEQNNPARSLYEKYGFEAPYLEMRLKRA